MTYVLHLRNMRAAVVFLTLIVSCYGGNKNDSEAYFSHLLADLWLDGADVVKIIWKDCAKKLMDVSDVIDHKEYFPKFVRCMKRKTLKALDRSLSHDVVPLADGINLVRYELVDRTGNVMKANQTSPWTDRDLEVGEWRMLALQRMAKVLRTHVIKFDFNDAKSLDKAEFRGRRRHMMTMMMFGIVSVGMVMVPMGFQFLAVLGGKAFVLAKMALILASIQGLKKVGINFGNDELLNRAKIAASPMNYGFYHTYPHPYEHIEKRSNPNWFSSVLKHTGPDFSNVPRLETGDVKVDRIHVGNPETKEGRDATRGKEEARVFPIYPGVPQPPPPVFTTIDSPIPLADLTTVPGEVQADIAVDMPYNGFRFQSPTPIVSA